MIEDGKTYSRVYEELSQLQALVYCQIVRLSRKFCPAIDTAPQPYMPRALALGVRVWITPAVGPGGAGAFSKCGLVARLGKQP